MSTDTTTEREAPASPLSAETPTAPALTPWWLDLLTNLENTATKGLWHADYRSNGASAVDTPRPMSLEMRAVAGAIFKAPITNENERNFAFIAALRNFAPALLNAARALDEQRAIRLAAQHELAAAQRTADLAIMRAEKAEAERDAAVARAKAARRWRPIGDLHEDHGEVVLARFLDGQLLDLGLDCALSDSMHEEDWTHFLRVDWPEAPSDKGGAADE